MLVNISPTIESSHETLCSLRFAGQVNQVELGKAKKNITLTSVPSVPLLPAPAPAVQQASNVLQPSQIDTNVLNNQSNNNTLDKKAKRELLECSVMNCEKTKAINRKPFSSSTIININSANQATTSSNPSSVQNVPKIPISNPPQTTINPTISNQDIHLSKRPKTTSSVRTWR